MPKGTVFSRPSGEPRASTGSPTAIASELPSATGGRPDRATLITATSDSGARPTRLALAVVPSLNDTDMVSLPVSTTWSLVITYPSAETTKPEPIAPVTCTVTTLGGTFFPTPASGGGARSPAADGSAWGAPSCAPPPRPNPLRVR